MLYATVDVTDERPSLPSVKEITSIMKGSPVVHGAEVRRNELAVHVLTDAYRHAVDQDLLRVFPVTSRKKCAFTASCLGSGSCPVARAMSGWFQQTSHAMTWAVFFIVLL